MKINLLAVVFLGARTSALVESSHSKVNESLHSSYCFHLGGTKTAAMDDTMDATLTFSGVEVGGEVVVDDEWGDRVKEIRASKEGELRELRAENEALKARLAEMESKNSWADINKIGVLGYLGVIGTVAWAFRHAATPATATKFACNAVVGIFPWVNQFADPVCDTFSYELAWLGY